jgi:hypothetical protein
MRGLAFVFAILLTVGALVAPAALADPPTLNPGLTPTIDCWNGSSDVSLHIAIRNQGSNDLPAGTTIAYSYRTSARGPLKSGKYNLDSTLKKGESVSFLVSPLQDWNPPIYQCTAKVSQVKSSPQPKRPGN